MYKMKYMHILRAWMVLAIVIMAGTTSCNKDELIYEIEPPEGSSGNNENPPAEDGDGDEEELIELPVIILDSETGIYNVKVGKELTIAPEFQNVGNGGICWIEGEELLSSDSTLVITWSEPGIHYIVLEVTNTRGTVSEELRVDVSALMPPSISLPLAGNEVNIKVGTPFAVKCEVANSEEDDFEIYWNVNGEKMSDGLTFEFSSKTTGKYEVEVVASNVDGADTVMFMINVLEKLPFSVSFPSVSYLNQSTHRYTFPGRGVMLSPIIDNLSGDSFSWTVDGLDCGCNERMFLFTPESPGEYLVNVTVDNVATSAVTVVCVDATEYSRFRRPTNSNSAQSDRVYEWVPAPGQFIGETQTGGMNGNETTHEAAVAWAESRLANHQFVSLGGFGGYIIVGFDHSVPKAGKEYDFAIQGNAFFNASNGTGGSNEPGIVYVMQDVNGNGLPDDEWYELRGSDTGSTETRRDYAVTYYKPSGPKMNVQWTDNYGGSGTIDYLPAYHRQDYYYPAWIEADSYTLRGTCLSAKTTQDSSTGLWDNWAFEWGYTDNMGSDVIDGHDSVSGDGQRNGFKISNAVYPDGTPVNLNYIDFIKVQTGVNSKSGWLGEVSTEVFGFEDLFLR